MGGSSEITRVRFAPSPTGDFHIGSARTAIFNWLFAKGRGGKFILRIEDTDKERSKKEYEKVILDSLRWLGIDWDEGPGTEGEYGPYRQSERVSIYQEHVQRLLDSGHAYYCYCTKEDLEAQKQLMTAEGIPPRYRGTCRSTSPNGRTPQLVRFKNPGGTMQFKDLIRGTVSFDMDLVGDFSVARNLSSALYNFAAVVDDGLMKITHVIRGEDHIANTPKQILMQKALGFETPVYAHIPLILDGNRAKLSKRKGGASLTEYMDKGYLPSAMINFLALLGWHPKGDREVFNPEELVDVFDMKRVQKGGAVFAPEKLEWINKEHMKALSVERLLELLEPMARRRGFVMEREMMKRVVGEVRDRMRTLDDFFEFSDLFIALPDYDSHLLVRGDDTPEKAKRVLDHAEKMMEYRSPDVFTREVLLEGMEEIADAEGKGSAFWTVRVALSGKQGSPDPVAIASILGKEESLRRVREAVKKLESIS